MAEFTPITTQEELDSIITARIQRERDKYADYDSIKSQLDGEKAKLATATETINSHVATINDLNAKVAKYETDSVKTRVCIQRGLPLEFAERLHGTDEATITADADNMAKLFKGKSSQPLADPEGPVKNTKDEALKELAKSLGGN